MKSTDATKRQVLERRIIMHLIDTMRAHGWKVDHVYDGGDECRNNATTQETLEHVFSVDESQIIFDKEGQQNWVSIILGNGIDCISDYSYANYYADTFEYVMTTHVDPFVESLE